MALTKYTKAETFEVVQEDGEKIASLSEADKKAKEIENAKTQRDGLNPTP